MISVGQIVDVRTYVTRRKTKARVLFVNWKHGWFTGEVKTPWGTKYNEAYWIRDAEEKAEEEGRKNPKGKRWWEEEDNPDYWLDEWSERNFHD